MGLADVMELLMAVALGVTIGWRMGRLYEAIQVERQHRFRPLPVIKEFSLKGRKGL